MRELRHRCLFKLPKCIHVIDVDNVKIFEATREVFNVRRGN